MCVLVTTLLVGCTNSTNMHQSDAKFKVLSMDNAAPEPIKTPEPRKIRPNAKVDQQLVEKAARQLFDKSSIEGLKVETTAVADIKKNLTQLPELGYTHDSLLWTVTLTGAMKWPFIPSSDIKNAEDHKNFLGNKVTLLFSPEDGSLVFARLHK